MELLSSEGSTRGLQRRCVYTGLVLIGVSDAFYFLNTQANAVDHPDVDPAPQDHVAPDVDPAPPLPDPAGDDMEIDL